MINTYKEHTKYMINTVYRLQEYNLIKQESKSTTNEKCHRKKNLLFTALKKKTVSKVMAR